MNSDFLKYQDRGAINMITENDRFENSEIECQSGNAIRELKMSKLLRASNIRKKKGGSAFDIFQFLLILIFQNCNLYHFLNSKKRDTAFSKNTYYRFLNNPHYNWKRFLTLLAVRVTDYFNSLTKKDRVISLVLDDSVIPRARSKKVELLSRIYDHVTHKTVRGFNMLTLGWTDGYSFVPVAFNMLASANAEKRFMQASNAVDKRTAGYKNRQDAVLQKPQAAIKMIRAALDAGLQASYVLMDTWFTNEPFIRDIAAEGLDVIGMLKDNKQRYYYRGRLYNLKQLAMFIQMDTPKDIFGSICVTTMKHRIPVKLVFVRNRNKKNEYIILLTTDCSLTDSETVRIYGQRWSIEVFFRAAKSLLCLGDEFQGLSYDMTVSSTALVFTRYILLEWMRRKKNDQKTICELFYVCCDDIQDIELSTALKRLLKIFSDGIKSGAVTINNKIKTLLTDWFVSQPAFIRALFPEFLVECAILVE